MKMLKNFAAGFLACLSLLLVVAVLDARITGTRPTNPDRVCWGPSGAEVCIDFSGNLIPTTDNDTTLGTSALRWATAYIMDITVGDDLTVTDKLDVSVSSASTHAYAALVRIQPTLNISVSTPGAIGELGVTSAGLVYVGTGTSKCDQWVKVGAQ